VTATLHSITRERRWTWRLNTSSSTKERQVAGLRRHTDEQSMVENYPGRVSKIINKESFDALLKRMKKKLEEKE